MSIQSLTGMCLYKAAREVIKEEGPVPGSVTPRLQEQITIALEKVMLNQNMFDQIIHRSKIKLKSYNPRTINACDRRIEEIFKESDALDLRTFKGNSLRVGYEKLQKKGVNIIDFYTENYISAILDEDMEKAAEIKIKLNREAGKKLDKIYKMQQGQFQKR